MKKLTIGIIIILVIASLMAFNTRNSIVKSILENSCKSLTNLRLTLGGVDANIARHNIAASSLKLYNPPGFEKAAMLDIPFIYIDYNFAAAMRRNIHFHVLKIDLKEMLIIRNQKGHLNFMSIKALQSGGTPKRTKKNFKIDKLYLSIGKVVYKDYYKVEEPVVNVYHVNLRNQLFENVNNPRALVSTIMYKALIKTKIDELLNYNINVLKEDLKDVVDKGGVVIKDFSDKISQKAEEATKDIKKTIRDIFIKEEE